MASEIFGYNKLSLPSPNEKSLTLALPLSIKWTDLTYKFMVFLITTFTSATEADIKQVMIWVAEAEGNFKDGATRSAMVKGAMDTAMSELIPLAKDLIVALVVYYLNSKKVIHINTTNAALASSRRIKTSL